MQAISNHPNTPTFGALNIKNANKWNTAVLNKFVESKICTELTQSKDTFTATYEEYKRSADFVREIKISKRILNLFQKPLKELQLNGKGITADEANENLLTAIGKTKTQIKN